MICTGGGHVRVATGFAGLDRAVAVVAVGDEGDGGAVGAKKLELGAGEDGVVVADLLEVEAEVISVGLARLGGTGASATGIVAVLDVGGVEVVLAHDRVLVEGKFPIC